MSATTSSVTLQLQPPPLLMHRTRYAKIFVALAAVVVLFQLGLAAGLPWGALAMGGMYPGRLPPLLRAAAVVQAVILVFFAMVVMARAQLAFPGWHSLSRRLIWLVVVFFAGGTVLNAVTPSTNERLLWFPVALALLVCGIVVARGR